MFAWNTPSAGPAASRAASPLLSHIAGEFAPRIAGLWPAPHAVFLTADAARRHLLCLCLTQNEGADLAGAAEAILHGALKAAIAMALRQPPVGLKRALEHMGEIAWSRAAYLNLLNLMAHPQVAKVLRHAPNIEAGRIEALAALPRPMLDAGGGRLGLDLQQARLAAEIYGGLIIRDGEDKAIAACRRWAGAPSVKDALGLMQDDLTPSLPPAPFVGTARLRPLKSHEEMRDAALRYRNCLRDYVHNAACGDSAFYEWLGEPRAIVEITRDALFGWRLSQARLVDNAAVPEDARAAICKELSGLGVHVGRSEWDLRTALGQAARPRFVLEPAERALDYVFADD